MMKKWLIATNEWFDSLEDGIKFIIFMLIVGGGIVFCEVKMVSGHFLYLPIYLFILFLWRFTYLIFKNLK